MLTLKYDLWPFGDKNLKKTIMYLVIANMGTSDSIARGEYVFMYLDDSNSFRPSELKVGVILDHDRREKANNLLLKVLMEIADGQTWPLADGRVVEHVTDDMLRACESRLMEFIDENISR